VEGAKPGEVVETDGVKIVGITNLPGRLAADASNLYSRNLVALAGLLVDKEGGLTPDYADEILVAHDGPCADRSVELARKFTPHVFVHEFRGAPETNLIRLIRKEPDYPRDLKALARHITEFSLRGIGIPEAFPGA